MLCEYGCGQKAKFPPSKGRTKYCCCECFSKCPGVRKKMSKEKIGYKPWNAGLKTGKQSDSLISYRLRNVKNKRSFISYYKNKHPLFFKVNEVRENDNRDIEVRCKKCDSWFVPDRTSIHERIRAIEKPAGVEENNLYCSVECKNNCETYRKRTDQSFIINEQLYTSSEYQTFRQEVLHRSNNKCEYCHESANIVHHSRPQKLEPGFALDPDFGISCCVECHYKYGHKDECSTGVLANILCS